MSNEAKRLDQIFQTQEYKLVSSGRCGIKQILLNMISDNDGKEEYLLPSYLCPSIEQSFKELNLKIVYYNVLSNLTIDLEDLNSKLSHKTKAIYFIHYFGVLQPEEVLTFLISVKEKSINLIEDITHNFFSERADIGDYLIGSIRKWVPLPHGGLVIVKKESAQYQTFYAPSNLALRIGQLRALGQQLKYLYLNELRVGIVKEKYLNILRNMDKALYSHIEIAPMDELSIKLLERMDVESISMKRRTNYNYLYHHLKPINEFEIVIGDIQDAVTPLGFHIALEQRDDLRAYLVKNGVYASIHWDLPQEVQVSFYEPTKMSKRILTIPCDQRYGEKEMNHIVKLMQAYFSGAKKRKSNSLEKVGEGI